MIISRPAPIAMAGLRGYCRTDIVDIQEIAALFHPVSRKNP
jgi:hypothetical protein